MTRPQPETAGTDPKPEPSRRDSVGKIAALLAQADALGTGARAELRRLDPRGTLAEPALQRLLARYVPEPAVRDVEAACAWGLVVHVLALAAPDALHGAEPLGRALQAADWKEKRLVNLLDADLDGLADHLPRAVRFLVARGQRLSAPDAADLVFSRLDEKRHGDGEARAEAVRRRIASDYYRAEARAEKAAAEA